MKSAIRKIGNSEGVIIPQSFLKECFIDSEVSIEVKDKYIVTSASDDTKRKGWEQAFKQMAANGDDKLVIPDVFNGKSVSDWTWR